MATQDDLDRAQKMAAKYDARIEQLKGKKIRVFRAIVYEGDAELVLAQLSRSMPTGTHEKGQPGRQVTITIIDQGVLKILEE